MTGGHEKGPEPADEVRRFDPPRAVEVLRDGSWWPGRQSAWVRWPDGSWRAEVRYTVAPGETYAQQVPSVRVRLRPAAD